MTRRSFLFFMGHVHLIMSKKETDSCPMVLFFFMMLITGSAVAAHSLDKDREILLNLKVYLQQNNPINQGRYSEWNKNTPNPCQWPGISCSENRVTSIILSENYIAGEIFPSFSELTALSHLDLSKNTIGGSIPEDLSRCQNLKYLNLSHNLLEGKLHFSGLNQLEVLDLSVNRIYDYIQLSFPEICDKLVVANLSVNNFAGKIDKCFDECLNLQYLDLSSNSLSGDIWPRFVRLKEFSVSENRLSGTLMPSIFSQHCRLQVLDLSQNEFGGEVPGEISNCQNLFSLNLFGNNFTGKIPPEIGRISSMEALLLGSNNFSREIPQSLLNLNKLAYLDLCRNKFGGAVQEIFGKFKQVKFLVLHGNSFTGGIYSSGILALTNISRLDLSYNKFSGSLPIEISNMISLKFLILAYNHFSGKIPSEYGNLPNLQALDLSFNNLTGFIPSSFGELSSLLWLTLSNNHLVGPIPKELGNCSSLLWLNLANNNFTGKIPPEFINIGNNPTPTFESNRQEINDRIISGSGDCLAVKRWIPTDNPSFNFLYTILTRKSCTSIWHKLLKGVGIFPICAPGSTVRKLQISGYIQLSGNFLSGELPEEIGKMRNFSMLDLSFNGLHGNLPLELAELPLVVLNISHNKFFGSIPDEIGKVECLQNLDFSNNNFSGTLPIRLNGLTQLSKFNISYNPLISGVIPSTGQLATFQKESYLGDPLLVLPDFIANSSDNWNTKPPVEKPESTESKRSDRLTDSAGYWVFVVLTAVFFHIISFYFSYTYLSF